MEFTATDNTGPAWDTLLGNIAQLSKSSDTIKESTSSLEKLGEQVKDVFKIGSAAAAIEELRSYNAEVQANAVSLYNQAQALGFSTDALQGLVSAGEHAGVMQQQLTSYLGTFNTAIGTASNGGKAQIDVLNRLGVGILDNTGKLRDNGAILTDVAVAITSMTNIDQKAAAAKVLFGRNASSVIPVLAQMTGGLDSLTQEARDHNEVMDSGTIAIYRELAIQSQETSKQIEVLYGQVAAPLELAGLQALGNVAKFISDSFKGALEGVGGLKAILDALAHPTSAGTLAAVMSPNELTDAQQKIATIAGQLQQINTLLTHPARQGADNSGLLARKAALEQELAVQQQIAAIAKSEAPSNYPSNLPIMPTVTTTGSRNPTPTGGARDRIQEAIAQYTAEAKSAQDALAILMSAPSTELLADVTRSAELQKKIGDTIASASKTNPNDPRLAQLKQKIILTDQLQQEVKRYEQALQLADKTEAEYGNGTAALNTTQADLNAALATGRLSIDAFNEASLVAAQRAADQNLKMQGLKGGIDGLTAGYEYAANQYARSNTVFQQGQKIFQQSTQLMSQALSDFVTKGQVDFGKLAGSFAQMLAQMALQAAASNLFGSSGLLGLFGLSGNGLQNLLATGNTGGVTAPFGTGGLSEPLAFAAGGQPPVGVPSIVGEKGPELFVPGTSGTIIPNDQLGGGGSVSINQTMVFGSDVDKNTLKAWGEKVKKETMGAVMNARMRGGKMKTVFT